MLFEVGSFCPFFFLLFFSLKNAVFLEERQCISLLLLPRSGHNFYFFSHYQTQKMKKRHIFLGSDHAGFEYKEKVHAYLSSSEEYETHDFGTNSLESCDYPDFSKKVASAVASKKGSFGVLFCGSANGVSMCANKVHGVRSAIAWNTEIATLSRSHNDANIVSIPCRFIDLPLTKQIIKTFLSTPFLGGRHQKRVDKIE